jgi:hypothetical protein
MIRGNNQCAYFTHAECKKRDAADEWMIANTLEIQDALEQERAVFPEIQQNQLLNRLRKTLEEA